MGHHISVQFLALSLIYYIILGMLFSSEKVGNVPPICLSPDKVSNVADTFCEMKKYLFFLVFSLIFYKFVKTSFNSGEKNTHQTTVIGFAVFSQGIFLVQIHTSHSYSSKTPILYSFACFRL